MKILLFVMLWVVIGWFINGLIESFCKKTLDCVVGKTTFRSILSFVLTFPTLIGLTIAISFIAFCSRKMKSRR